MVSQYEQYFKEESLLYNEILASYESLKLEDIIGIDELRRKSLTLASNYVTMKSNADIIAKKLETNKTQFSDWCYQKYRVLMEIHTDLSVDLTHCRNDLRNYREIWEKNQTN